MDVRFTKMQGAGNDFIVVDEWEAEVIPEEEKPSFVAMVSDRHFGVGSDGVIFVQKSSSQDARFHFFNPDGSIAEMCGNGIRCFAKYAYEKDLVGNESISVETLAGVKRLELEVSDGIVRGVMVSMGAPQVERGDAQVTIGDPSEPMVLEEVDVDGNIYVITAVGMGNPHAVLFVDDVDEADVLGDGSTIRHYVKAFPNGVNVHFVEDVGDNEFRIRTYERGVEGETLACGTGICASAVASALAGKADTSRTLVFHARGGIVKINLDGDGSGFTDVRMTGPAETVFTGNFQYKK
ncbi:MAG: diaminopimelate epimerase [Candidatus Altiarchaeota archaeon]